MSVDHSSPRCWKCGADLKSVPRPFSRFAECPRCRVELHVCRMCRHYDRRYIGECSHDFADKVLVKDKANFCGHFRPSPHAFEGADDPEREKARQRLSSLFGEQDDAGVGAEPPPGDSDARSEAEEAKKRLADLFKD